MYELSDLFELETCLLSHDLNQNQITTVKLTNDRWHCIINIFGLYINLFTVLCIWYCNTCI